MADAENVNCGVGREDATLTEPTQTYTQMIEGLQYIAESPPHEHGGFHPSAVETAKNALLWFDRCAAEIHMLERELGR